MQRWAKRLRSPLSTWLRPAPAPEWTLTQRRTYILPTGAGLLYALLLLALLTGAINDQLSLGYLLVFVLAGIGVAALHATHANLLGLRLSVDGGADEGHRTTAGVSKDGHRLRGAVGQPCAVRLRLQDGRTGRPRERRSVTLRWQPRPGDLLAGGGPLVVDLDRPGADAAADGIHIDLPLTPSRRGLHASPPLVVETRYPLGLCRAWTVWQPALVLLAWPAPEADPPALPPRHPPSGLAETAPDGEAATRTTGATQPGEVEGLRPWRDGDAPRQVHWRRSAHSLSAGGLPWVRQPPSTAPPGVRLLREADAALPDREARLARLCAWLLQAHTAGESTGLLLADGSAPLAPLPGSAGLERCLDALALATLAPEP